jgi:NRPS condensation-like uncharacterized protein
VRPGQTLPFTEFEEAVFHLQERTGPWNIQFEIAAQGRLDEQKLRDAIRSACERHPLARARLRHWAGGHRAYEWFIPDQLDIEPLSAVDCLDDKVLSEARTDLYSLPLPLDVAPAFRAVLARRPAGDLVLFSVSHVGIDGVGGVRFLRSVASAYRGDDEPADRLSTSDARAFARRFGSEGFRDLAGRALEGGRRLREALDAPARIAIDGGSGREGFGFVTRKLDPTRTRRLADRRPEATTLNDVMLAALHLTIDRWNRAHDARSVRIATMMPVNTRSPDWFWEVVGNFASFATISTTPDQRTDLATAASAIRKQTDPVYRAQRAHGLIDLVKLGRALPVGVKRQVSWLLPLSGNRFVDSAVLSNLGRLADRPGFDDATEPEIWFSPPCAMPLGVGIGAVTAGGALHLVARYRLEQFDDRAAEAFTDFYLEQLDPQ